jgi:hypothetical protein
MTTGEIFMKTGSIIIVALLSFLCTNVSAQDGSDPGQPDTILIRDSTYVNYNPGNWSIAKVPIYFITDDSIAGFNLPLTWISADNQIWLGSIIVRNGLYEWDWVFDSIMTQGNFLRLFGICDIGGEINPLFNSYGQRVNVINLIFIISPTAIPQHVYIDSVADPIGGRVSFWDFYGTNQYVPIFYPGVIIYGSPVGIEGQTALPDQFTLKQNYPNPFNPQTQIEIALPKECFVALEIFNILGQKIASPLAEQKPAGYYSVIWDGKSSNGEAVPSGVYFYRLTADDFVQTKKMIMLK